MKECYAALLKRHKSTTPHINGKSGGNKMKRMTYILLTVASMSALSCAKEVTPETNENLVINPNLVEVTLTAEGESEDESKAVFSGYPKIAWEGNEEISLLGLKTGNEKLTTTSKGHTATFTGYGDKTDDVYYAVYPYDSNVTLDGNMMLNVTVPSVQKATAGSFDPKAYIAVAKSTDKENLYFKAIGGFVKFQLEDAPSVKSVTMVSNSGANMACSAAAIINDDESVSHGKPYVDGTTSTSVRMEGTFETGKAYFMVVRPQPYTGGITIYIEYKDGKVLARRGESELFEPYKSRNFIRNLNVLKKAHFKEVTDKYSLYLMGYDVEVAGQVINLAKNGPATLITSDSASKGLNKSGVYFIDGDVEVTFNSGITNLVVVGNNPTVRSVVKRNGVSYLSATAENDVLIMENVEYVSTTNIFQFNQDHSFETIAFKNCLFSLESGMNLILSNSAARTMSDFSMTDCDFQVKGTVDLIKMGGSTINSITIDNNVIYGESELTGFTIMNAKTAKLSAVVFNNNTLYNTTIGGTKVDETSSTDAIFTAANIKNINALNNYIVCSNSDGARFIARASFEGGSIGNNFYVRKSGTNTAIYGVPGTMPDWVTEQPAVKAAPENLTTNWDPANGNFKLGGYTGVGATR